MHRPPAPAFARPVNLRAAPDDAGSRLERLGSWPAAHVELVDLALAALLWLLTAAAYVVIIVTASARVEGGRKAKDRLVTSLVYLCFLLAMLPLVILMIAGRIGQDQFLAALALIPAVLLGSALSRSVHSRINGPALRLAVLIFSIVSGAALVLKG